VLVPQPQDPLQPGDELFFVTTEDVEEQLERLFTAKLSGGYPPIPPGPARLSRLATTSFRSSRGRARTG
jgi:hypothetical protein